MVIEFIRRGILEKEVSKSRSDKIIIQLLFFFIYLNGG